MPSAFSEQLISVFEGPSTARESPPEDSKNICYFFPFSLCYRLQNANIKRQRRPPTCAGVLGDNGEVGGLVDLAGDETGSEGGHVSGGDGVGVELDWTSCNPKYQQKSEPDLF